MSPAAILFDVFGTLLDVYSVEQRADSLFPGWGGRLAQLWRDKQLEYTRLRSMSGRYVGFTQVTRDALEYSCAALRLDASPGQLDALMQQYDALAAFPESHAVLDELRNRDIPLGVLSNGDPGLLRRTLDAAGLLDRMKYVLSADSVGIFKTAAAVYELGPAAIGSEARRILFVSSNCWDACGATWFGYTTCWINRAGAPLERLGVSPDFSGRNLHAVFDALH